MTTLGDIPSLDWCLLAQDYADTNAVLIPRLFYCGIDKKTRETAYIIDDYELADNNHALYKIIGTKKESYSPVLTLCARMMDLDDNYLDDQIYEFDWNPKTFSWCYRHATMSQKKFDNAFELRGIDSTQHHEVLVDLPFGHVVAFSADVQKILDKSLHPFYTTKWPQLGPIGSAISQRANIFV